MAILTISGAPASRFEEVAHECARLLGFEFVTESRLSQWMTEEFGETAVPDRAWQPAAVSILARLAVEHHLVLCLWGAESLFPSSLFTLRAGIIAPEPAASETSCSTKAGPKPDQRMLTGPKPRRRSPAWIARPSICTRCDWAAPRPQPDSFDVMLNSEHMDASQMAEIVQAAATARRLHEQGLLAADTEARIQFEARLKLARYGIVPAGHARLKRAAFNHPSEEVFANLLDFYRIAWEYEPRSFPLQWDKDGRVIEAFTPDFYLPEFDLYVEITTMKQTLVTRKNRKIKLLRAVYPHINIQVFYQKDYQDLVFKHGLKEAVR